MLNEHIKQDIVMEMEEDLNNLLKIEHRYMKHALDYKLICLSPMLTKMKELRYEIMKQIKEID